MKSLSHGEEEDGPYDPKQLLSDLGPAPHARGLLLLAEMSMEGNLMTPEYTQICLESAQGNKEFVVGFISQRALNAQGGDNFISMAPGVTLPSEGSEPGKAMGDGKGQRWRGPKEVIGGDGIDVAIVGRGILGADDRRKEAQRYQSAAWEAYEGRIGRR